MQHVSRQAVLLCCLDHPNLVGLLGLYSQRRGELELPYIISPWMDRGDIVRCMDVMAREKKPIPRIRWVNPTSTSHEISVYIFRTRFTKSPAVSDTYIANVSSTGTFIR